MRGASTHLISQRVELLQPAQKVERLVQLLGGGAGEEGKQQGGLALVFANTIPMANKVRYTSWLWR